MKTLLIGLLPPERHHALAGDHLEPPFFVSRSNEASVNSNGHLPVMKWAISLTRCRFVDRFSTRAFS